MFRVFSGVDKLYVYSGRQLFDYLVAMDLDNSALYETTCLKPAPYLLAFVTQHTPLWPGFTAAVGKVRSRGPPATIQLAQS